MVQVEVTPFSVVKQYSQIKQKHIYLNILLANKCPCYAGVDGSRAFVTGDFKAEGLIDDIAGLGEQDYIGLRDWLNFYEKDYEIIGKFVYKFHDS